LMRVARRAIALLAGTLVVFANTSAYAAILTDISGQALVNRGGSGGYQLAVSGMVLNPGDVVVVNPGGAAQISYSDGCTVPVQAGAVVTVTEISPCANTAAAAPPEPTGTGLSTTTLVLGLGRRRACRRTHYGQARKPVKRCDSQSIGVAALLPSCYFRCFEP
jgi:hypothetical protein